MNRAFLVSAFMMLLLSAGAQDDIMPLLRPPTTAPQPAPTDPLAVARAIRATDPAKAIVAYRQAIATQPWDTALRLEFAEVLERAGQPAAAAAQAEVAWQLAPAAATAVRLIDLQIATDAALQAAAVGEQARAAFPHAPGVLPALARAFVAANLAREAGALADDAGDTPELRPLLARLLLTADRPVAAWQAGGDDVRAQLRPRAVGGAGLLLFPPTGWLSTGDGAAAPDGTMTLSFEGPLAGDPAVVARDRATAQFGTGMAAELARKPTADEPKSLFAPTWSPLANPAGGVLSVTLPMPGEAAPLAQQVGVLTVPTAAGVAVVVVRGQADRPTMVTVLEQLAGRLVVADLQRGK